MAVRFQSGEAYTYEFATTKTMVNGKPTDTIVRDEDGVPQPKLDAVWQDVLPDQLSGQG